MHPRRYSGEGRTGICVCGHSWEDHHLGVTMNPDYPEPYLPQECEFFGFNEGSGLDAAGKEHCWQYRDSALPDEHN